MNYIIYLFILFICVQACNAYYFVTWPELHRIKSVDEFKSNVDRIVKDFACEDCRAHFENLVETHMFPLEYVDTLEEARLWLYLAHNSVNLRIGKPWQPLTILDQYEHTCSS